MGAAFGWGTLAASSLVIGALIAVWFHISLRVIGLIMGFGAGVLISAVSFDLIEEAAADSSGHGWIAAGLFAGCLVFFGGDRLIDKLGGKQRKDPGGDQEDGSAMGIVLGSVLDGIPGLGEVRRKRLVKELGSVKAVKAASLEDLQALPWLPGAVAEAVHGKIHGGPVARPRGAPGG